MCRNGVIKLQVGCGVAYSTLIWRRKRSVARERHVNLRVGFEMFIEDTFLFWVGRKLFPDWKVGWSLKSTKSLSKRYVRWETMGLLIFMMRMLTNVKLMFVRHLDVAWRTITFYFELGLIWGRTVFSVANCIFSARLRLRFAINRLYARRVVHYHRYYRFVLPHHCLGWPWNSQHCHRFVRTGLTGRYSRCAQLGHRVGWFYSASLLSFYFRPDMHLVGLLRR